MLMNESSEDEESPALNLIISPGYCDNTSSMPATVTRAENHIAETIMLLTRHLGNSGYEAMD